ncbi:TPR repeat-containing protein, partial [Thiorhodococcus drewsii AZ1]
RLEAEALAAGAKPTAARAVATERLDALYKAIFDKANALFLYLAFLIDRIRNQGIPADSAAIQALPARVALFHDYLEQLQDELGPKHADLALTLVLTLAAAERAHAWLIAQPEWPPELDQTWRGLALDVLARLTHQTGAEAELLYVVLRLRPVLGTWRAGTSASAHYRLGVRGLTEAVKKHPELGPRLMATHRRLADEALALAADAPTTVSGEAQPVEQSEAVSEAGDELTRTVLLRQALAHASLGGDADQGDAVAGNRRLIGLIHAEAETRRRAMELPAAILSTTCWLLHARHMARTGDVVWLNALASAYNNRGLAKQSASGHGPAAALADYDAAIAIRETVRQRLEPDGRWEVDLRNDLASAYVNRGLAKQSASSHGPAAALADYDAAIAIREAVRQRLEPEGRWEVALRNALATAYMNRGLAKQSASDH